MERKPETFVDGRIRGGYSLHDSVRADAPCCQPGHRFDHVGPWRTVECGGHAGEGRDIVECAECGAQKNVACNLRTRKPRCWNCESVLHRHKSWCPEWCRDLARTVYPTAK